MLCCPDNPINPPKIRFQPKQDTRRYRAIAQYDLIDGIVISLTAQYLRHIIDPCFLSTSYAFRAKSPNGDMLSHHDAVQALLDYRCKYDRKAVCIAECDLQGFFDTVNHDVALCSFQAIFDVQESKGVFTDPRALSLLRSYLDSYSFPTNVLQSKEIGGLGHGAIVPWPEESLAAYYDNPRDEPIGVPQGGALSCLIANAVLHPVDEAIELVPGAVNGYYARYCDDMMIAHTSDAICEAMLDAYIKGVTRQLLVFHRPTARPYGAGHWDTKSRSVYRWGPRESDGVPWVAFVGYQVRYDGLVRIRPSSLAKELEKQVRETGRVVRAIELSANDSSPAGSDRGVRVTRRQAVHRLRQRLIAMSVGRPSGGGRLSPERVFCWSSGFKLLAGSRIVRSQLRRLDRGRGAQISRARRRLRGMCRRQQRVTDAHVEPRKFYGRPYSYDGAFE